MNETNEESLETLRKEDAIKDLEGYKIYKDFISIHTSFSLISGNYRDFKKQSNAIKEYSDFFYDNSIKRNRMQKEVIRIVHNLSASFKSHTDHINKLFYVPDDLKKGIISEFEADPLINFFRVLRNYLIHNEVLPLVSKGEFKKNMKRDINPYQSLKQSSLLEYLNNRANKGYKKDKAAMEFLKEYQEDINLDVLISKIMSKTCLFHNSVKKAFLSYHFQKTECFFKQLSEHKGDRQDFVLLEGQYRYLKILLHTNKQ